MPFHRTQASSEGTRATADVGGLAVVDKREGWPGQVYDFHEEGFCAGPESDTCPGADGR